MSGRSFLYWLHPPVFEDEESARVAQLFHAILLLTIVVNSGYMAVVAFRGRDAGSRVLVGLIILAVQGFALVLEHRGYVRTAACILLTGLWAGLSVLLYLSDDYPVGSGNFNGYTFVIIIAGLLFGGRWAFSLAGLSIIGSLIIPQLRTPFSNPQSLDYWLVSSVEYILIATLPTLAHRTIQEGFARMSSSRQTLSLRNALLQKEIDERLKAEEALRHSQQQYQDILDLSPAGIIVHGVNGQILYTNAAGARLLGASSPEAIMGRSSVDFMSQEYLEMAATQFIRPEPRKVIGPVEYCLRRLDEQPVEVQIHSIPMNSYQGQIALLDVVLDITQQKRAQKELITAELTKIEITKEREVVDLKEQFVSMVSHEFRNPLTTILASKEILERYADRLTPQSQQEHLHQIGAQVQFMTELLNNVLTVSRAQARGIDLHLESLDLETHCRDLFNQIQQQDGGKHTFRLQSNGNLNPVQADKKLITHIVGNLLTNAARYSPNGAPVDLKVSQEGETIIIQVEDKGIGIPKEDQGKLFEVFHRASNAGQVNGTGLGLVIVKTSVEALGGTLTFDSQEGVGTTFTVRLPFTPQSPQDATLDGQSSPSEGLQKATLTGQQEN